MLTRREQAALDQVTRVNTYVSASTFGLLGAATLAVATVMELMRGDGADSSLRLLSVFLWGYGVSGLGVLAGAFWGLLYGAVLGALVYQGYARTLRVRLAYLDPSVDRRKHQRVAVLRLEGKSLGVVVGLMAAVQLVVMTHWLSSRGAAAAGFDSTQIAKILPGYSVTPLGSVIGAAELFAIAFLAAWVLAALYNEIVDWRQRQSPGRR
jgi:hypothetical protein